VAAQLRSLILDGTLPPGHALLQIELAQRLGVSRTPLREAFRVLEHEGFVRATNGNNTLEVVNLSQDEMFELYQVREMIDGLAARLLAERGLPVDVEVQLMGILERMHSAEGPYDAARRAGLHADFHTLIVEQSGNRHVVAQTPIVRLSAQMLSSRMRAMVEREPGATFELLAAGFKDHLEIVAAIKSGDGRKAEDIARRHIRKTMRSPLFGETECPTLAG
jgi:GntR family transcriptional regulator of vanillate catabolism